MTAAAVTRRAGLTEVPGLRVGHFARRSGGWRTGTTVVLADAGAIASGEARGGGPGTRETDLLRPEAMIERIDAICLTGGSAYGLAAADGVMAHLAARGRGFRVGPGAEHVVPIVPTAVIFDLGRGGAFDRRPDATFGRRAAERARRGPVATGAVGAGTGAQAGWLQGGVGTARTELRRRHRRRRAGGGQRRRAGDRPVHRAAVGRTPAAGCAARRPANVGRWPRTSTPRSPRPLRRRRPARRR